jgi:hypothetical protein
MVPMAARFLDPTAAEQNYNEENHHDDEEQATRPVAIVMITKARPRANAPKQQKDDQDNQE